MAQYRLFSTMIVIQSVDSCTQVIKRVMLVADISDKVMLGDFEDHFVC